MTIDRPSVPLSAKLDLTSAQAFKGLDSSLTKLCSQINDAFGQTTSQINDAVAVPTGALGSLPAASAGDQAIITDSDTVTWGGSISGSGTGTVLAWYNGTNWTVIGV